MTIVFKDPLHPTVFSRSLLVIEINERLVLSIIYKTLNDTDHSNLVISIVPQRGMGRRPGDVKAESEGEKRESTEKMRINL